MRMGFVCTRPTRLHIYFLSNFFIYYFVSLSFVYRVRVHSNTILHIYIYIRLKIKPNSVRIKFQSCQIFVLPSTGFEPTPLLHCSTIRLALRPAPQTTRLHPYIYTHTSTGVARGQVLPRKGVWDAHSHRRHRHFKQNISFVLKRVVMAYFLIILQCKFDSPITTEHAGIKKNINEAPNFCC